jgi:DNA-binding beta-propeller fold protein YncE/predicted Ser/Thr protein kinase
VALRAELPVGSELAGYRVDGLLGRGGMSVVYLADDPRLRRGVALKLIAPELAGDDGFRERFLAESKLAASLEHPNVVPIYEAGESDGELYIAMRHVEGGDLRRLLDGGALAPERALAICGQIAAALDAAHARGLVHRDVKPSNVLLDADEHVYLADFGLTRRIADPGGADGRSLGTPAYLAPEQIRGEPVDGRADQYALGCLLYECLTGEPPFRHESDAALLYAHLEREPPARGDALDPVIAKALAKEPEERYPSCAALVADAREALGLAEPRSPRWPLALAAAAALLIAAALLAFLLTRGDGGSVAQPQGGRVLRIDPESNRVVGSVTVGDGPEAVATGSGRVWIASYDDGTLWQLDPRTGGLTKVPAFGRPYAVTVHEGSAYVAALGPGQFAGNVSNFDAVTGGRVGGLQKFACSVTSGAYGVWAAGCPNVLQLGSEGASQNPSVRATVPIPYARRLSAANFREAMTGIAMGEDSIWVLGDASDRRLWRIDPARHRITATIELGFPPGGVAAGGGAVWVTDQLGDRLVRIDPTANRVERSIPVGRGAGGVAFGGGSVWVADAIAHTVTRVDPRTTSVVATIRVPASPRALTVGEGSLWVVGDAR